MSEHGLIELPYDYDALEPAISEKVMEWHHDVHHQGYVNGWNSAEEGLEEQRESGDFSSTGSLLNSFTHNFCGNILHEIFWKNMSPNGGGKPEGELLERIEEEFGSYGNWKQEFVAAAKSASGWALLVYVPYSNELHNVAVD
ncbi:MAG: superoxide dismutase, partial [Nanohaloarchaea archaeon SW_7_46_7]